MSGKSVSVPPETTEAANETNETHPVEFSVPDGMELVPAGTVEKYNRIKSQIAPMQKRIEAVKGAGFDDFDEAVNALTQVRSIRERGTSVDDLLKAWDQTNKAKEQPVSDSASQTPDFNAILEQRIPEIKDQIRREFAESGYNDQVKSEWDKVDAKIKNSGVADEKQRNLLLRAARDEFVERMESRPYEDGPLKGRGKPSGIADEFDAWVKEAVQLFSGASTTRSLPADGPGGDAATETTAVAKASGHSKPDLKTKSELRQLAEARLEKIMASRGAGANG